MDIPRRCFLTVDPIYATATDADGTLKKGGCLQNCADAEEYSFTELIAAFRQQVIARKSEEIQFIFFGHCPSLYTARAAVFACRKEKMPLLISMDCHSDGETIGGDHPTACLITLQALGITAFGVGGDLSTEEIVEILDLLSPFSKIPLMAAPQLQNPQHEADSDPIAPLLAHGILVMVAEDESASIRQDQFFRDNTPRLSQEQEDEEDHIILANAQDIFVIHDERLEFTEPLACSPDMADELLAAEEDSYDVLLVRIDSADDGMAFAENAHLAALPVMFNADQPIALKTALMLYNGRAMIDSESSIEKETLQEIAEKYGSVLY